MFGTFILSTLVVQVTTPKVTFEDSAFKVSGALGQDVVPFVRPTKTPGPIDLSKGRFRLALSGKTVTFDSKGLTISENGRSSVSKMRGVPTSGKIATKDSNRELMQLVMEKKRSLDVSALSGWELVDKSLYMLFRWDGDDKKCWLEALMKVDLTEKKPQARLVGRFEGISFARATVDDVLVRRADKLALLSNKGDSFGLAKLSLDGKNSIFERLGQAVGKARFNEDDATAWSLTPTAYGTNILGVADLDQGAYHVVSEFRGKMVGVFAPAYARYSNSNGLHMVNLLTGAEIDVQTESSQQQTSNGLLVWSPSSNPKTAVLFDSSFRKLATWSAPINPIVNVVPVKKPAERNIKFAKLTPKPIVLKKALKPAKPLAKKPNKPKFKVEVSSHPSKKKRS